MITIWPRRSNKRHALTGISYKPKGICNLRRTSLATRDGTTTPNEIINFKKSRTPLVTVANGHSTMTLVAALDNVTQVLRGSNT
jgi:hypothetical protein